MTERQEGVQTQRIKFLKILVAVDGSEESFRAAQYAVGLAKRDKAQLIALTVSETPSILSTIEPSALEKWREQIKVQSEIFANKIRSYGLETNDAHLRLRSEVIDTAGSTYAAIVDYAEKENVDLIVIGTRGKTGLKKVLLGSVASGVVTYATCPVLIVK